MSVAVCGCGRTKTDGRCPHCDRFCGQPRRCPVCATINAGWEDGKAEMALFGHPADDVLHDEHTTVGAGIIRCDGCGGRAYQLGDSVFCPRAGCGA